MFSTVKKILFAPLLLAAVGTSGHAASTQVSAEKPIINFRVPTFTAEGFRDSLVRGSEARFVSREEIVVKDLNLSVFTRDNTEKVKTLLVSPSATFFPTQQVVTGTESIRVIDDEFEASGVDWRYAHKEKRITINQRVRVKFRAEITNLLQ